MENILQHFAVSIKETSRNKYLQFSHEGLLNFERYEMLRSVSKQ